MNENGSVSAGPSSSKPDHLLDDLLKKRMALGVSPIKRNTRSARESRFPLSPAQQGLWFLSRTDETGMVYNQPLQVVIKGMLDVEHLKLALKDMVMLHDALRTSIVEEQGEPVQVVADRIDFEVEFEDLGDRPEVEQAVAEERALEVGRTKFDLAHAPLFRCVLLQLKKEEFRLLFCFHHIIFDSWSQGVFLRELFDRYRANVKKLPLKATPPEIQYPDSSVWLQRWLDKENGKDQMRFWRDELSAPLPVVDISQKETRSPVQVRDNGARYDWIIPAAVVKRIAEIVQEAQSTSFMMLLSVFKMLLNRYSGVDDIIVGSPVPNRSRPEFQSVIGCFVNMLALRTKIREKETFLDLLSRVRQTCLSAFANAELPFEQVVAELPLERDPGRHPVYQTTLELKEYPVPPEEVDDVELSFESIDIGVSTVDLSLQVDSSEADWTCRFNYNAELFDAAAVERMAGHFMTLLESVCADPGQRIFEVPLLTVVERKRLLEEWNATQVDFADEKCVHHLFEEQAEKTPGSTAILFEGEKMSYADLDERANRLAHFLVKKGVGPEVKVGICLRRGTDYIIAAFAVWKAGGAYVPLDPLYPAERIAFMIKDSDATLLLTEKAIVGVTHRASRAQAETVLIDAINVAGNPRLNPGVQVGSANLAYVIYTSGSSGSPKGVQVEHRSLVNFLQSMQNEPGITSTDTLLAVTTACFDISGLEFYLPLISGARLSILSNETAMTGRLLVEQIKTTGTMLQATPSTWRMLLDSGWRGSGHLKMLCGGEGWPRKLASQLLQGDGELWNMYGPTETTIWSGIERVEQEDNGPVLIGRPIANTRFYVLDKNRQLVPEGATGELYIGGAGVARGYYNRADLTAASFMDDPFVQAEGARMYRTGDLARWTPEGRVECLGRTDLQVKVRGFRIEIEEVESVLERFPGIAQVVVQVTKGGDGNNQLTGYYTVEKEEEIELSKLRKWMKENVPDYMIPHLFVQLDKIPLTENGKADRKGLPEPGAEKLAAAVDYIEPKTADEAALAEIWCEVLGVKQVGRHDNFFELGGHSLLAIRLIDRLAESGYSLQVDQLFLHPTIGAMARIIQQSFAVESEDPGWSSLVTLKRGDAEKVPLFIVHTAPGDVLTYASLIHHLKTDQPCYGFQSLGLHDAEHRHRDIDAMAAHYVELMEKFYPSGPYMLLGWCYGGTVAAEMAVQLKERGREVSMVALCDTWAPLPREHHLRTKCRHERWQTFRTLSFAAKKDFVAKRLHNRWTAGRKEEVERQLEVNVEHGLLKDRAEVYKLNSAAAREYRARYFSGKVKLFRPDLLNPEFLPDLSMGWHSLVEDYEMFLIPGDHRSMIHEPNVRILARHLQRCIDEC